MIDAATDGTVTEDQRVALALIQDADCAPYLTDSDAFLALFVQRLLRNSPIDVQAVTYCATDADLRPIVFPVLCQDLLDRQLRFRYVLL